MAPLRPKYVAYYRVSTQGQGRSGLGLEAQRSAVDSYLQATGGQLVGWYRETESGKHDNRPELQAALLKCRQTRGTLLVAKLDRLSRNVAFLMQLRDAGVKLRALDLPEEMNTLTLTVMAGMAQHEREMISARTRAALQARKARGQQLGTPRDMSAWQAQASTAGTAALQAAARQRAEDVAPCIEAARAAGITSLCGIASYLNNEGVTTPRGKAWTATAVARTLKQLGEGV